MRRRTFLAIVGAGGVTACVGAPRDDDDDGDGRPHDDPAPDAAGSGVPDGVAAPDACAAGAVLLHDTFAQALYLDGSLGPLTGVCEVAFVIAGAPVTLDFWHGHGGQLHRWTLEPAHYDALRRGERITVTTTTVDGHEHTLFVDPLDEAYRVPGAPDVPVPAAGCVPG